VVDLTGLPADQREAEAARLVTEVARVPFDLAQGPLLRPRLVKITDADHRLYLVLHHIIFDVISLYTVFLPELITLYNAFRAGEPSPLPEPALQYGDYTYWQRQRPEAEMLEPHLSHWHALLDGLPTLQLPTDHPRRSMPTWRIVSHAFTLPGTLIEEVQALAHREGASLYMTLLAAFVTLLHRYAGQDEIVVGTPSSNRDRPEVERMMGYFLHTLVLRTNLAGDPTFRDVLAHARSAMLEAHAHQHVPFEVAVREIQPKRNVSQEPVFQAMFTLEPPRVPLDVPWAANMMEIGVGTRRLDLSLELDNTGNGINGRFQYNPDLFGPESIARMVGHYRTLLEGVVASPGRRVAELPLLTDAERHEMLIDWNATEADYPRDQCLHEAFEAQAARTPDAIAALFEGEQITYRALDQRANQLAHHLRAHGVEPDTFVGVCVERSLEMLVAVLAVMKAGGAYLPLDPAYPRDRLAFMLDDAQVRVLLTQQRLAPELPAGDAAVICLDRDWDAIAQQPTESPQSAATPENLAYIIYTSGSTGKPKGVMIPHRALMNLLCSMRDQLGATSGDIILAATSLSFDIAGLELYLPLLVGARIVIVAREVAKHGRLLAALIETSGATMMQATPTTWRILLESGWQGDPHLHMLCGGEALPQNLARQLLGAGRRLTNLYGPTETTIWSTLHEVQDAERPIPLGRPIANTQVYILDRYRQPTPVGVPGELHIGGDGVTRGYLNRPELTAERFIPDPFSARPCARLYATGDLARYLPDGTIEFLGRIDNQVKVRGFRIELGEIETLLERHDGVRQAVVIPREDVPGSESLAAYIVLSGEPATTVSALREALAAQLPDYMVPSAFVVLDAMPMTPNGKVDRKALPAPSAVASAAERSFVAPEGILQLQLARIWEEILDVRPIGITDDFFELGGTSLLAARLVDRIMDVCGQTLPLATLFAGATIEHIEGVLLERKGEGAPSSLVQVQEGNGAKRPLFFLHGDLRDGGLYCVKLARALDPDRPFYGIHPSGTDGTPVARTLKEIAADRLAVLRAAQPEGPYLLGGFCAGAFVAFEMAQQLRAQGEQVDALIMVEQDIAHRDTWMARALIGLWGALARLDAETQQRLFLRLRRYSVERAMGADTPDWIKTFPQSDSALAKGVRRLSRLLRPGRPQAEPAPPVAADDVAYARSRRTFELECRYMWATSTYTPRPYGGRVAMFWARDEHARSIDELAQGWKKAGDHIDVYTTPGTHFSSITTHAEALAERMGAWLEAGEAPTTRA
jgi:amino acid adenylation domain-containing protein